MEHINNLDSFESVKNDNGFVLLKFSASWCKPCQIFAPVVEQVSQSRSDVTFASIDVDEVPSLRETYKVRSVPTLILLKNGSPIDSLVGSQSPTDVNKWIDHAIEA